MKTRKWVSYPRVKCLGGKLAAMLATMLLLLAPANAIADDGYIVILSDDGKTLTFKAGDETTADYETCWTLDSWNTGKNNEYDYNICGANKLGDKRKTITTVTIDPTFASARPTKTTAWFKEMTMLDSIEGLNNLNTSNVTDMSYMFYDCDNLKTLDLRSFNTENVTNMKSMFLSCHKFTELNLSSFNTTNVTDMSGMLADCDNLTELNLSGFDTQNVTDMHGMFYQSSKLTKINLTNFKTDNVKDMQTMFYYCRNLKELDLSSFNTTNVTNMSYMFSSCYNLGELDLNSFNTTNVTNMSYMFQNCEKLDSITFGKDFDTQNVTDMSYMFKGCSNFETLNLSSFNTTNVTNMSYMFKGCGKLNSITFGKDFDTQNVTDMSNMFYGCSNFETLALSNFNTKKVKSMGSMFYDCSNLKSIDLSSFNTITVAYMGYMFKNCDKLESITFGKDFDTQYVTNMSYMFNGCRNLKSLDLSNFNTTNVTNIKEMLGNCSSLANLTLGNNDFKKATDKSYAFYSISNCKLTVGAGFDVSVLGTVNTGTYTWEKGQFTLQLALDEDNAVEFAAATESGTAYNTVVLKRTFNDNAWNTLVVPFDISEAEAKTAFGENVKIAKYTGTTLNNNANEDGYEYILNFETSTEGITANEPVFIYGVETTSDNCYTFADKTVTSGTPTKTDESQNVDFVGTYKTGYVPQGNYFIAADNKIYCAANAETNTIKATRATFQPVSDNNEAKIVSFVIGGETTGISLPTTAKHVADGTAYNLQGQRVGPGYKGVVIQQGKKYLRK